MRVRLVEADIATATVRFEAVRSGSPEQDLTAMPELPEVQALAADLGARLIGRTIARFDVTAFSALKTYDPPVSALEGGTITGVGRFGKYLDIVVEWPARRGGRRRACTS